MTENSEVCFFLDTVHQCGNSVREESYKIRLGLPGEKKIYVSDEKVRMKISFFTRGDLILFQNNLHP